MRSFADGRSPRRSPPKAPASRARDLAELQSAVGNRALAQMLSGSSMQSLQRTPSEERAVTYTVTIEGLGSFEAVAFSWAPTQMGAQKPRPKEGAKEGEEKGTRASFVIVKPLDKHTTKLANWVAAGTPIKKLEIVVASPTGRVVWTFGDVSATSFSVATVRGETYDQVGFEGVLERTFSVQLESATAD